MSRHRARRSRRSARRSRRSRHPLPRASKQTSRYRASSIELGALSLDEVKFSRSDPIVYGDHTHFYIKASLAFDRDGVGNMSVKATITAMPCFENEGVVDTRPTRKEIVMNAVAFGSRDILLLNIYPKAKWKEGTSSVLRFTYKVPYSSLSTMGASEVGRYTNPETGDTQFERHAAVDVGNRNFPSGNYDRSVYPLMQWIAASDL